MFIPNFNQYGVLPEGIYICTLKDIKEKFCSIDNLDVRCILFKKFESYVKELKKYNIPCELMVDGSFITNKVEPSDIDLLIAIPFDWDPKEYKNTCFMLINEDYIKLKYNFSLFSTFLDTESLDSTIDFYRQVKGKPGFIKGILKVIL